MRLHRQCEDRRLIRKKRSTCLDRLSLTLALLLIPVVVSAQTLRSQEEPSNQLPKPVPQEKSPGGSSQQTQEFTVPVEKSPAASQQTPEITSLIPKQYEGCWVGTFRKPSEFQQLNAVPLGEWFSVTYDLCFKWASDSAPEVTLTKAKNDVTEAARHNIDSYEEPVWVTAVEPGGVVKLHGTAHFLSNGAEIDDENDLVCKLLNDGQALDVERTQLATCSGGVLSADCNGSPWYRAAWHAQFTRASE